MPPDVEILIDMEDRVYGFSEAVGSINLRKKLARKDSKMGRPRYGDCKKLNNKMKRGLAGNKHTAD